MLKALIAAAFAALIPSAASAVNCDAPVGDEAGIISDVGKVDSAARIHGYDVRVRTVRSFAPHASITEYRRWYAAQCPSWFSGDKLESNVLLLFYSLDERKLGIGWGPAVGSKLKDQWESVKRSRFDWTPTAYQNGDKSAYTNGFALMLGDFNSLLHSATPAHPTGPANVTIHNSKDYSGILWALFGLVVVAGAVGGFFFWRNTRSARESAKASANAARSSAVQGLMEISKPDRVSLIDTQVQMALPKFGPQGAAALQKKLATFKQLGTDGKSALATLEPNNRNPLAGNLSVEGFEKVQRAYQNITDTYVAKAKQLQSDIDKAIEDADKASENLPAATTDAQNALANAANAITQAKAEKMDVASADASVLLATSLLNKAKAAQKPAEALELARSATEAVAEVPASFEKIRRERRHEAELKAAEEAARQRAKAEAPEKLRLAEEAIAEAKGAVDSLGDTSHPLFVDVANAKVILAETRGALKEKAVDYVAEVGKLASVISTAERIKREVAEELRERREREEEARRERERERERLETPVIIVTDHHHHHRDTEFAPGYYPRTEPEYREERHSRSSDYGQESNVSSREESSGSESPVSSEDSSDGAESSVGSDSKDGDE